MKYFLIVMLICSCSPSSTLEDDIIEYKFLKMLLDSGPQKSDLILTKENYKKIQTGFETDEYIFVQYQKPNDNNIIEIGTNPWFRNIIVITKEKKFIDKLLAEVLDDGFKLSNDFTKFGVNAQEYKKKDDYKFGISENKGLYKASLEIKGFLKQKK